jgi:hypothetical protein
MSRIISKKRALLTAAIASLALVAVAIAYYSTTGSGANQSGGTTAAGLTTLQITGTADASTLVPGGSVAISNGNIHNPNTTASAKHGTISATVDATDPGCSDSYFHVTGITPAGTSDVIAPSGDRAFTATLGMDNDTSSSQDACKSTALKINWSSN